MTKPSIAIVGHGRMGRAVEQIARQGGWNIAAIIDAELPVNVTASVLGGAGVAIEFSEPSAAANNIRQIVAAGCPIVVGTTGWYSELDAITRFVEEHSGKMLWAPNFSVGVHMLLRIAASSGGMLSASDSFDAHIVETHHTEKKDAPSGTALALGSAVESSLGRSVPITSVRTGHVPGTHELIYDGPFEQIRISHVARDRNVFAAGALLAAEWLAACKRPGVYTFADALDNTGGNN